MERSSQRLPDATDGSQQGPHLLSPRQRFQHSPLDHQAPSIRLIRILQDLSIEGLLQCDIRHASIDSTYVCLSYVWGEESSGQWILLVGERFWVRENLSHFLQSARRKPHVRSEWLWIDALCIDQANNSERTHQVQQMGLIFSHATKVISWMGNDKKIAEFLGGRTGALSLEVLYPPRSRFGMSDFYQCGYWNRAWITQEIALARKITFMAVNSEVDREQPPEDRDVAVPPPQSPNPVHFENYSHRWRGRSLVYLLQKFRFKDCSESRDRVFSLLALCGEGSDLRVDYDISYHELAMNILQACRKSFCLCSIRIVDHVLCTQAKSNEAWSRVANAQPFAQLAVSSYWGAWRPPNAVMAYQYPAPTVAAGYKTSIEISLDHICKSFNGLAILQVEPGTNIHHYITADSIMYHYTDCDIGYRYHDYNDSSRTSSEFRIQKRGCHLKYRGDIKLWTISLPFEMLVDIAGLAQSKSIESCSRVSNQGTTFASPEDFSPLSLCSDRKPLVHTNTCHSESSDIELSASQPVPPPETALRSVEVRYVADPDRPQHTVTYVYNRLGTD